MKKIVMGFLLLVGMLQLQGCCVLEWVINPNSTQAEANAAPVKVKPTATPKKEVKKEMSQQAQDLSKIAETSQTDKGIVVRLKGDVLFTKAKTGLSAEAKKTIAELANVLKKYPNDRITVVGYTDNSGDKTKNVILSRDRAGAVKAQLVKEGIVADKVRTVGKGDADPVAPNDTDANRAKNRRAEIKIETSK